MKRLFHHGGTENTEKAFDFSKSESFSLRVLRISVVNPIFILLLFLPFLQGCGLLFVQQGETYHMEKALEKAPQGPSQATALSHTPVIQYKVKEGDSLPQLADWYFGNARKAEKIAKDNQLTLNGKLREGTIVKIVDPVFFPDPKDLGKKPKETKSPTPSATPKKIERPVVLARKTPSVAATQVALPPNLAKIPRPKENLAFAAGEKLKYQIRALGTLGAYASTEIERSVMVAGRPCYPLVIRANTVFPFSAIYPVNDLQTSYFDAVDFLSWKFENRVQEGSYKAHNKDDYDQVRHKVTRSSDGGKPEETDVPPFTQDIVSWLYYFRLLPLETGKVYLVPMQSRGKNFQLLLDVLSQEKIDVPAGAFNCLKVKIIVKSGTAFRNNEGDVQFWITDDPRHIVVKTRFSVIVGNVDIDLLEATLPPLKGN